MGEYTMKIKNFLMPSLKERFFILIGTILLIVATKTIDFGESITLTNNKKDYNSTKFILNLSNKKTITVDDNYNLVHELYFNKMIKKRDIKISLKDKLRIININNIYIDDSYSKVDLKTQKLELRTEAREFGLAGNNTVYGVGTQLFGIRKSNVFHFYVNKNGYFITAL